MVKTGENNRESNKEVEKIPKKASKKRPIVQVVACPSAFPISQRQNQHREAVPPQENTKEESLQHPSTSSPRLLDWKETVKEVRRLGSKAFTGQLKRQHEDEEYKKLTGRHKKKHQVPLPIVRGIKKKAAERQAQYLEECKQAGIVLPKQQLKTQNSIKQPKNANAIYGPAPSIGFIKHGILRVKDHPK
jgi:hypothetical protein